MNFYQWLDNLDIYTDHIGLAIGILCFLSFVGFGVWFFWGSIRRKFIQLKHRLKLRKER